MDNNSLAKKIFRDKVLNNKGQSMTGTSTSSKNQQPNSKNSNKGNVSPKKGFHGIQIQIPDGNHTSPMNNPNHQILNVNGKKSPINLGFDPNKSPINEYNSSKNTNSNFNSIQKNNFINNIKNGQSSGISNKKNNSLNTSSVEAKSNVNTLKELINSQSVNNVLQQKNDQENNKQKLAKSQMYCFTMPNEELDSDSFLDSDNKLKNNSHIHKSSPFKENEKPKKQVPRLKLETLPNYHGKFNECINHLFNKQKEKNNDENT